jgi:DNA-binding transcriptional regulator YiaG
VTGRQALEAARRRHPSVRTPVPASAVAARLAEHVARSGARWPEVAAAVLADRGTTGLDPSAYAESLGVSCTALERAEAGALGPDELPAPLLRVLAASLAFR